MKQFRRTKILATLGPSCSSEEMMRKLIQAGANLFRFNFSHGSHDDHLKNLNQLKQISSEMKRPVSVLADLQGPKIRIGKVVDGGVDLIAGEEFVITTEDIMGAGNRVSTIYTPLAEDVKKGDTILLDDGLLELKVKSVKKPDIFCKVVAGGVLTSNKGINLPNVNLSTPALTEKDQDDLQFALENEFDFVALSFVRKKKDLLMMKEIMRKHGKELPIISKIEKPEALEVIDDIIDESYGVMVARGDLGVEIPPEEVPIVQKDLIRKCNAKGKPVIVATQVLDSMIRNPRPTRAEASDVANAVLDGADVVMLSGETAAGKYPEEAVKMMATIIKSTEAKFLVNQAQKKRVYEIEVECITDAICKSASKIARNVDAQLILAMTHSGQTAKTLSRIRADRPIMAITPNRTVVNQLALHWGVRGIFIEKLERTENFFKQMDEVLLESGLVNEGELIVVTAGVPTMEANSSNTIKVHVVQRNNKGMI